MWCLVGVVAPLDATLHIPAAVALQCPTPMLAGFCAASTRSNAPMYLHPRLALPATARSRG